MNICALGFAGAPAGCVQETPLFLYVDVLAFQSQPAVWQPALRGELHRHLRADSIHRARTLPGVSHACAWWDITYHTDPTPCQSSAWAVNLHSDWFYRERWGNVMVIRPCPYFNLTSFCHVSNFSGWRPAVAASLSSCKNNLWQNTKLLHSPTPSMNIVSFPWRKHTKCMTEGEIALESSVHPKFRLEISALVPFCHFCNNCCNLCHWTCSVLLLLWNWTHFWDLCSHALWDILIWCI